MPDTPHTATKPKDQKPSALCRSQLIRGKCARQSTVRLRRQWVTLRATSTHRASIAAFSFYVDRALTNAFRPGDMLYLTRTGCGGLGLSAVRAGRLVAAVGVVTAVPLGESVSVRIPVEVVREAEHLFEKLDREFRFPELPI